MCADASKACNGGASPAPRPLPLLHPQQLHLEDQRRVGRDHAAGAAAAVAEVGGDDEPALAADLHADQPLVPPLDGVAGAEAEGERAVAAAAGVEPRAVPKPAGVLDR